MKWLSQIWKRWRKSIYRVNNHFHLKRNIDQKFRTRSMKNPLTMYKQEKFATWSLHLLYIFWQKKNTIHHIGRRKRALLNILLMENNKWHNCIFLLNQAHNQDHMNIWIIEEHPKWMQKDMLGGTIPLVSIKISTCHGFWMIKDIVQELYAPDMRPLGREELYKLYPDMWDHDNPYPRSYRAPHFTLFWNMMDNTHLNILHDLIFNVVSWQILITFQIWDWGYFKLSYIYCFPFICIFANKFHINLARNGEAISCSVFLELSHKYVFRKGSQKKHGEVLKNLLRCLRKKWEIYAKCIYQKVIL